MNLDYDRYLFIKISIFSLFLNIFTFLNYLNIFISAIFIIFIFFLEFNVLEKIFLLYITSIPLSYSTLSDYIYINLYIISLIFLILFLIFNLTQEFIKKTISKKKLLIFILSSLFFLINFVINYFNNSINAFIASLPIFLIIPYLIISYQNNDIDDKNLDLFFISIAFGFSLSIVFQFLNFKFNFFDYDFGRIWEREGRLSFSGNFYDFTTAAMFLTPVLFLFTNLWSKYKDNFFKYYILLSYLVILIAIILINSRASLLAIPFGIIFLILLKNYLKIFDLKMLIFYAFFLIFAIIGYSFFRFTVYQEVLSNDTRFDLWFQWIDIYLNQNYFNQIFGQGLDYNQNFHIYNNSHNLLIDILMSGGVVLFIYISLIVLYVSYNLIKNSKLIYFSIIIPVFAISLLSPSSIESRVLVFYLFLISVISKKNTI